MRSSSNSIADKNVNKKPRRWENSKNILFLENKDLELMNDLENSVNNFTPENISQAELDTCVEKLSKLFTNKRRKE